MATSLLTYLCRSDGESKSETEVSIIKFIVALNVVSTFMIVGWLQIIRSQLQLMWSQAIG